MAALDELATPPPPIEAAAGASEEIDAEVKRLVYQEAEVSDRIFVNRDT